MIARFRLKSWGAVMAEQLPKGRKELPMHVCALCKKTRDLFTLDMVDDCGEPYQLKVCGTCWEVTATIARKAIDYALSNLQIVDGKIVKGG